MLARRCALVIALAILAASQRPVWSQDDAEATPKRPWTGVLDEESFAALHELRDDEVPALRGEMVEIGEERAYLSLPEGGRPTGALLVIHEWWGLNDHIKHWADRLAADGYAALAVDLYRGTVATTREEAMAAMRAVDDEAARKTLLAAHAFLADDARVRAEKRGSIGWCFGGGWSLQLALNAPDLDAAVMYYGRLETDPERLKRIEAPLLAVFGNRDRGIPPESVDEFEAAMRAAGRAIEVHRYDADHAFANPSSARYDGEHAAQAFAEVRRFLHDHLSTTSTEAVEGKARLGTLDVVFEHPSSWRSQPGSAMRAINFKVGEDTECYVMAMGGTGGGVAANVRRWVGQMGQPAPSDADIAALPTVEVLGQRSPVVGVSGSYRGMGGTTIDDARMLGLICTLADQTVFAKMIGPRSEVEANDAAFRAFCESLRRP